MKAGSAKDGSRPPWRKDATGPSCTRFPLDPATLALERRDAYDAIVLQRGGLPLPYRALLASPQVAVAVEQLSRLLWSHTLPRDVLEAVFLVIAKHYRCDHQWSQHTPQARAAGLSEECISAIAGGLSPSGPQRVRLACQVSKRLLSGRRVGDILWPQAIEALGEEGLANLCAFLGLASLVAMTINVQDAGSRMSRPVRAGPAARG